MGQQLLNRGHTSAAGVSRLGRVLRFSTAALLGAALSACALGGSDSNKPLVKDCVLPPDQAATIAGHWRVTPIPIAFATGSNWQPDEIADMVAAADTWNKFYSAT